ncbi:MAG: helix-turn-helix transcriptional regulator [Clostridia bacterium]|nr:helix-turn-helix transcriptional regulator [Clostridia bacterium]
MNDLAKIIGQRIRSYRTQLGLSQEKLAELADYHPTYIGQLERGEKNATLESINRVAVSLNISLSQLFENLGGANTSERNIPLECYEFLLTKSQEEQEQILKILIELDRYKGN